MIWFDLIWFDLIWFDLIWFDLVWFDLIWFDLIWFDLVWFGLIWFDLVWFDLIWFDLIWFGLIVVIIRTPCNVMRIRFDIMNFYWISIFLTFLSDPLQIAWISLDLWKWWSRRSYCRICKTVSVFKFGCFGLYWCVTSIGTNQCGW